MPPRSAPLHRRPRERKKAPLVAFAVLAAAVVGAIVYVAIPSSTPTRADRAPRATTSSSTTAPPTTTSTTTPTTTSTTSTSTTTTTAAPPSLVPPSGVVVEVLNGNGQLGVAASAASALAARGFTVNGTGNAVSYNYPRNLVAYPPGLLSSAETVAHYVSGASTITESSEVPAGEVWLIIGATYDGVT